MKEGLVLVAGASGQLGQVITKQLLAAGFAAEDVVLIAPPDKPTKGNVVVRYRSKSHGAKNALPPVLFLGHLDVVVLRSHHRAGTGVRR